MTHLLCNLVKKYDLIFLHVMSLNSEINKWFNNCAEYTQTSIATTYNDNIREIITVLHQKFLTGMYWLSIGNNNKTIETFLITGYDKPSNVRSCTISSNLWATQYRKVDESVIDIVISRNRHKPYPNKCKPDLISSRTVCVNYLVAFN